MPGFSNRRRLPSLNALRAFEAAARHLSFKDAASELNVSQSAISHQVKALEESLGLSLFTRRTRGIELTRKGKLYYPVLRNALDSIAEGTDMILESGSTAVLTLQVYSTFTIRWLLPRLASFQQRHPEIQVRLTTAQADVNFEQDDVDAAIMIGHPNNASLHYDYLFDAELYPVCSPSYLEKVGGISSPHDLNARQLLQVYPSANDWHVWLEAHNVEPLNTEQGLQLESYDLALSSAVQDMGVALGQQPYTERDLAAGTLVEVFPGLRVRNPRRWHLACRSEKTGQSKLQVFREWLLQEVQSDENLPVTHASG
jgi:LysR family glycine cleavage system transcriptional activator